MLTPANKTDQAPAQTLAGSYYREFIDFIDRGEATTRSYYNNLRQFAAYLAYTGTTAPTRQDIINYRQYLGNEHDAIQLDGADGWKYRTDKDGHRIKTTCKPATVKNYLQSVKQFFTWTDASGYYPNIAANIHAPKIRQDIHKKEALTAADVLAVENSITVQAIAKATAAASNDNDTAGRYNRAIEQGQRLKAIYLLAVTAGLRCIEISRANVKDIERHGNRAYIYIHGKGHTEADTRQPIALPVYEAIREYLKTRGQPKGNAPLFAATGNRSGGKRLASTTISTMLKQALIQAGYNSERISAHSLRHTAGTAAQDLTGNLYLTQQYMRHASPAITEIYLHTSTEEQEAIIAEEIYKMYHNVSQSRTDAETTETNKQ